MQKIVFNFNISQKQFFCISSTYFSFLLCYLNSSIETSNIKSPSEDEIKHVVHNQKIQMKPSLFPTMLIN
jgi:hypothetical protein